MPRPWRQSPATAAALLLLPALAIAQGKPAPLPDGPGKERVEQSCMACHQAREILNSSGYTREGRKELLGTMIDLNKNGTLGYLDPKTGKITEFKVPDPEAKDPHSAIFDAKGILWFTMQVSNRVGRFDPASGEFKIAEMSVPNSRPYGIKIGPDGAPWFACNGRGCVVRIDPATMALTEVKVPGSRATVRRLDFDREGHLWYVNSGEGRLGRYTLKTGEIKEWPSPSGPRSQPYAIVVIDGIVGYNESGQRPDALVRFDPKNESYLCGQTI